MNWGDEFDELALRSSLGGLREISPGRLLPFLLGCELVVFGSTEWKRERAFLKTIIEKLCAATQGLSPIRRLQALNRFVFQDMQIRVPPQADASPEQFSLRALLSSGECSMPVLVTFYLHLAESLDIHLSPMNLPRPGLLKWPQHTHGLIDLSRNGEILNEEDIARALQGHQDAGPMDGRSWLVAYLEGLYKLLKNHRRIQGQVLCLGLMLDIAPNSTQLLGERGLLHKELNQWLQALEDFRRYFSFVPQQSARPEIRKAWEQLSWLHSTPTQESNYLH